MSAIDSYIATAITEFGVKKPRLRTEVITRDDWVRSHNKIKLSGVVSFIVRFNSYQPGVSGPSGDFIFQGDRGDSVVYNVNNCRVEGFAGPNVQLVSERITRHQSVILVKTSGSSVALDAWIEIIHLMEG